MSTLPELLKEAGDISADPRGKLDAYLSDGRKAVGCMPYFCPEELVHAAGMVPFGVWGAQTQVSEARRYLPAFICSIVQTTLELGIRGKYDGLSAIMIPILCDSLKSMDGNWRYGVKEIPVIPVAHAQNRKIHAGSVFTASQYRKTLSQLQEISGKDVSDDEINKSIALYKNRNAAVRRFMEELSGRPAALSATERCAVLKSGYFTDVVEYTSLVTSIADCLAALPVQDSARTRLVTCGIIADNTGLLSILDDCGVSIVDDVVSHESLRYRFDAPDNDDPVMSLALMIGEVEGCPVLYDPGKKRADMLADVVRQRNADGVLFVMTKFCDPEEYDIVPLKKILDREGIRLLVVEVDQQTTDLGQVRTAVETFCEIVHRTL